MFQDDGGCVCDDPMKILEDEIKKGLKEDNDMENSCKQWFLRKVISFYSFSQPTKFLI